MYYLYYSSKYLTLSLLIFVCLTTTLSATTKTETGIIIRDKNLPKQRRSRIVNFIKKMDHTATTIFPKERYKVDKTLPPCTIRFDAKQDVPITLNQYNGRYVITLPVHYPEIIIPYEKLMRLLFVRLSNTPLSLKTGDKIPYWIIIGAIDEIRNTHFRRGLFVTLYLPGLRCNATTQQFPKLTTFLRTPLPHKTGTPHHYYREVSFFLFKSLPVKNSEFKKYISSSLKKSKNETQCSIFIDAFSSIFKKKKPDQLITMEEFQLWFNKIITKKLITHLNPMLAKQSLEKFNSILRIKYQPKNKNKKKKRTVTAFCSLEEFNEYYERMENGEKIKKHLIVSFIQLMNNSSPLFKNSLKEIINELEKIPKTDKNYKKEITKWILKFKEQNKRLKNIELCMVRIEKCNTPLKVYFTNSFYELDYQNKLDKKKLIRINQYLDKIEKE
jgi:hypothetical protein